MEQMISKDKYNGKKCNHIITNYKGPNGGAINILTTNGWTLIGAGVFGFIFSNDNYNCVIKIPKDKGCEVAEKEFNVQSKLFNLTNGKFYFAKIPEPYLFHKGEAVNIIWKKSIR